jgi:FlaA1/EpsC-like NDP-sugar epimerase
MAPIMTTVSQGAASVSPAKLLNRPPIPAIDPSVLTFIAGKRILVTGAGGSIGSELVRQLLDCQAAEVFALDHDESALHSLSLHLHGHGLFDDERMILADVRDGLGLLRIFRLVRPHVVYHAAAHKHLPLLERYPIEGLKTNVLGTKHAVAAAIEADAGLFVNISTDKAARPTSALGVTKRLAEMIVAEHAMRGTRVASVRFGNVLGSRGSFMDSLTFQIANDQPVTITDPDVTRFFMTIPEAAGLVIQASLLADQGETYVLDMGEPIRIVELVRRYAILAGIPLPEIRITGLRVGEKLHEQLFDGAELTSPTKNGRVWAVTAKQAPPKKLTEQISKIARRSEGRDSLKVLLELSKLLPDDGTIRHPSRLAPEKRPILPPSWRALRRDERELNTFMERTDPDQLVSGYQGP